MCMFVDEVILYVLSPQANLKSAHFKKIKTAHSNSKKKKSLPLIITNQKYIHKGKRTPRVVARPPCHHRRGQRRHQLHRGQSQERNIFYQLLWDSGMFDDDKRAKMFAILKVFLMGDKITVSAFLLELVNQRRFYVCYSYFFISDLR